jgi:hypothetical protein
MSIYVLESMCQFLKKFFKGVGKQEGVGGEEGI